MTVESTAFENASPSAKVFVEPENASSFGGGGATWFGLTVSIKFPIVITGSEANGSRFMIRFIGESAIIDWKIKGSSGSDGFEIDLTSVSAVSEVMTGVCEAAVDISEQPNKLLLRVER